jgi:hypothetical protein
MAIQQTLITLRRPAMDPWGTAAALSPHKANTTTTMTLTLPLPVGVGPWATESQEEA